MTEGENIERLRALRSEYEKGIEFHAISFREIDDKAKYWLTLCIPSLLGLIGYSFERAQSLSPGFVIVFSAVGVCLFSAIYYFALAISSARVEGGVVVPEDEHFDTMGYFLESDDGWRSLAREQARETFAAFIKNERCNRAKSRYLGVAEDLLFLGVPTAACFAVGAAFAYASAPQGWLGTAPRIAVGAIVGAACSAIFLIRRHIGSPRPE